jgi:hypothetical protein
VFNVARFGELALLDSKLWLLSTVTEKLVACADTKLEKTIKQRASKLLLKKLVLFKYIGLTH